MKNIGIARNAESRGLRDAGGFADGSGEGFTPGAFLRDAGSVIAVCLGLGLLLRVLLG